LRLNRFFVLFLVAFAVLFIAFGQSKPAGTPAHVPTYTEDGRLLPPVGYREWIYLTTGLDMSYTASAGMDGMRKFDNAFVNPEAYHSFLQTGTWPDKTMILLEGRPAESNGSINKAGHFQGQDLMGIEVHVKDEARGGWAFYAFDSDKPAEMIPKVASCYSCHQGHAAVDTTFVQFYPTLLPIAKQKGTLSSSYLKDESKATK
jgi:hypothetical protein